MAAALLETAEGFAPAPLWLRVTVTRKFDAASPPTAFVTLVGLRPDFFR